MTSSYLYAVYSSFLMYPQTFKKFKHLFNKKHLFGLDLWFFEQLEEIDKNDFSMIDLHHFNCKEDYQKEFVLQIMGEAPFYPDEKIVLDCVGKLEKEYKIRSYDILVKKLSFKEIELEQFETEILKIAQKPIKTETQKNKIDIDLLSPFMKAAFLNLKRINNYPDSMVLCTLLSSLGGLIGARARISNGFGVSCFPIIWSLIIAPSSISTKSTLFKNCRKLIFGNLQNQFYREYEEQKKDSEEEEKEIFLKRFVFAQDTTPEALIKALYNNQNGGIIYHDEFKAEIEKCNFNLSYKALKTSLFEGNIYDKELVGSGALVLKNPCISEVGAITEFWLLEALKKSDLASGFLARYLFSYNKKEDFAPLEARSYNIDFECFEKVSKTFIKNYGFDCAQPTEFSLSSQAKEYYKEWFDSLSSVAFDTENDEELTMTYRLTTYALKFCLISYIFNNIDSSSIPTIKTNIPLEYLKEGIEIMNFFRIESEKIIKLMKTNGRLNYDPETLLSKAIKKIQKHGGICSRTNILNIRGMTKESLDSLIESEQLKQSLVDGQNYISFHFLK